MTETKPCDLAIVVSCDDCDAEYFLPPPSPVRDPDTGGLGRPACLHCLDKKLDGYRLVDADDWLMAYCPHLDPHAEGES